MNYTERRKKLFEKMQDGSALILHSGIELHISADDFHKFEANRNFFYLTGLRRDHMVLFMTKAEGRETCLLLIEEADPNKERWTGKKVTIPQAREISGIQGVSLIGNLNGTINQIIHVNGLQTIYTDLYRYSWNDLPDYNVVMAEEVRKRYPGVRLMDISDAIAELRMVKDEEEIAEIRTAIELTDAGLKRVMSRLQPGKKEYQAQADFEYEIFDRGAEGPAFHTIAGSGMNGTMMHYNTNRDTCEDGTLLLLDLGARCRGYNADITRTYPVNGVFSERQRKVYEIVLAANREVAKKAAPGMTLRELNDICTEVLRRGCMEIGLIEKPEEIGRYYMHSVSHHLGIDVHDVTAPGMAKLRPGAVITDEPGLYIDEWGIGIRIEDDLLITEDGCEVLSKDIIREPEEIEAFMAANRK